MKNMSWSHLLDAPECYIDNIQYKRRRNPVLTLLDGYDDYSVVDVLTFDDPTQLAEAQVERLYQRSIRDLKKLAATENKRPVLAEVTIKSRNGHEFAHKMIRLR